MTRFKPATKLTPLSSHFTSSQELSKLKISLENRQVGEKERRIIHQLLPNLNKTVQIICSYTVDGNLLITTDNSAVASRIRFIVPQLKTQLSLKTERSVKVVCRPIKGISADEVAYWDTIQGSEDSGNCLMAAASDAEQQENSGLASALRRLAATIAR